MRAFRITFVVVALVGLGLTGGGVFLLVQRETGTRAKATVTECLPTSDGKYGGYQCTGTWVDGGKLVGGAGHVVSGTVEGAEPSDIGKPIGVTLSGSRAYTTSLTVPILLLAIGLFTAAVSVLALINGGRPNSGRGSSTDPVETHPESPAGPS
jgi:hypothetical protein